MKQHLLLLLNLSLLLPSFSQSVQLRTKPCDYIRPEKREGITCGYIDVPEDHDNPNGKKISIAYAILHALNKDKSKPPIILLNGGPGAEALRNVERWTDNLLRQERDLIVFDQRGIGHSSALPNPDVGIFKILAGDFNIDQEFQLIRDTLAMYKRKCIDQGIQLEHYITSQNAADVNFLMENLGYQKYVLYGESYGTRLARVVMDRFSKKISSVIADAPAILEDDFLSLRIKNYNDGLEKIFMFCEGDLNCKRKYPTLRKDYFEGLQMLDKNPIQLTIGGNPFYVNPQDALFMLRYQLYAPTSKTSVPAFIKAIKERDVSSLNTSQQFLIGFVNSLSLSLFLSTGRNEEYDETRVGAYFDSLYSALPNLPAKLGFFTSLYKASSDWHTKVISAEERKLKSSAIPTLIFVNKYDPVTPPKNGFIYKETLRNAKLFVLDAQGHGVFGNCVTQVMIDFINDPNNKLSTSCLPIVKE